MIAIGPLVLEIFMFESVDTLTHTQTDGQKPAELVYYKHTLWASGSGELKMTNMENNGIQNGRQYKKVLLSLF